MFGIGDNIVQTCMYSTIEHDLLSADDLRDYFEKFGTISDATVKTDPSTGRSKGFGFVVFVDPSAVDQVITAKVCGAYVVLKRSGKVLRSPEIMLCVGSVGCFKRC